MAYSFHAELANAMYAEQEEFAALFRLHDTDSYRLAVSTWARVAEKFCLLSLSNQEKAGDVRKPVRTPNLAAPQGGSPPDQPRSPFAL
jgi:hypothetical protein